MDSNTYSTPPPAGGPSDDGLGGLITAVDDLAAQTPNRLAATVRARRLLAWRQQLDRQEGLWLQELAALDALGAAGADQDAPAPSTAGWLRNRLRMSGGAARSAVRTARALFRGPLPETAAALTAGAISPAHAQVVAEGTRDLPEHVRLEADPVLVEAARRLDPPLLRQAVGYLVDVADPAGAEAARQRRYDRRGLWLAPTLDHMVAIKGLLEPEAGHLVQAALEPLARPAHADDTRHADQRNADALAELCRRALEGGQLPKAGGVRPQLLVTVDLDSLQNRSGGLGGEAGWVGPLDPEACRRLACDGTVTRVLVTRQLAGHQDPLGSGSADQPPDSDQPPPGHSPDTNFGPAPADTYSGHPGAANHHHGAALGADDPSTVEGLQGRLRAAMAVLPPSLGGAPSRPLDVGRATRVVQPAQRAALAVRDGGCVFPGCDRPLAWCEAHHLVSWLDGGPTNLGNLALLCWAHHRTVHEGGWQLIRGPDERFSAAAPQRRYRAA
jgi:hypothetical protein